MSKYAVIRLKGKQYKVEEGQELLVDKVRQEALKAEVLLLNDDGRVKLGKPTLSDVNVGLKMVDEEIKGDKIYVLTYKAKSRYRRKKGFRPRLTRIAVVKITS